MISGQPCPLCGDTNNYLYHRDEHRPYLQCSTCQLVFVPKSHLNSAVEEKAHYDTHQNSPDDAGYRKFLNRLLAPLSQKLTAGACGLDFGAGPGPTLSVMLEELGFPMNIYDPFYANNPGVLQQQYDFITCTETAEHLYYPGNEFNRLWSLLKTGGYLAIMTRLITPNTVFSGWYYTRDPTHVCFYSRATFQWLAEQWRASIAFADNDVILICKADSDRGR